MPIPRLPAKHTSPAYFEPIDHLDYFRAEPAWNPQFRAEATARGLVRLFDAARATLAP